MNPDCKDIVKAVQQGNSSAAAEIIELHYERIYAFLRRLAGHDQDAADLTQKTFARVWQSLPTFAGRSSVGSWIHSIAYHQYLDWRRITRKLDERPDEWWANCASAELSPADLAARSDLGVALYRGVDQLDPALRDCVHLHYYQELTLQETAEAMGVATSTIKYRLRQAMTELQRILGEQTSFSPSTK